MKSIVRDDIISLNSFVAAEFKYKNYLELLLKAGNYCFLDQFKKIIPSGQSIIKGMIEHRLVSTENINKNYKYLYLTDTAMKYLYLRYSEIDYTDVEKNKISVMKVNKFPSEKQLFSSAYKFHLLVNGEKLIDKESILNELEDLILLNKLNMTYKTYNEWFKNNSEIITKKLNEAKESYDKIDHFKKIICSINKNVFDTDDEIIELKKLNNLKNEIEQEINEINQKKGFKFRSGTPELNNKLNNINLCIDEVNKRLALKNNTIKNYKNYFLKQESLTKDFENKVKSFQNNFNDTVKNYNENLKIEIEKIKKVFENLYNISKVIARINQENLEFIILDCGTLKSAGGYLKLINKIQELNLEYKTIKIIIFSYSKNRALNLEKDFKAIAKKKLNALNTLKAYNARINEYDDGRRPDFYINANKIYDSIPDFSLEIRSDFYYMESYKNFVTSGTKSIKRKDKKAIENLIENLKNG